MAVKAGSLITVGNGVALIERLQSGGPGALSIPSEKIYELGNYTSVATIRDTPDLTFTLESFDVSTDTEQVFVGMTDAEIAATGIDLATSHCLNVAQNLKPGKKRPNAFVAANGVAIPYLTIESASYKFGLKDNATETFTLKGDSIYYCPGAVYIDDYLGTAVAGQAVATVHPAYPYTDANGLRRVLCVTVANQRLTEGADYTLTEGVVTLDAAIVTVTLVAAVPITDTIYVTYHSPDPITYAQTVHTPATLKPAAVKGRDIDVYIGGYNAANPALSAANKWTGVQDITLDWKVTQEVEMEFGNPNAVSRDFDVPTVSGSISILPRDVDDLYRKLRAITGKQNLKEAIGPDLAEILELDIIIKDASAGGATLKRFHVPDARFSLPGYSPRVEQNITISMDWESDQGVLTLFSDLAAPFIVEIDPATDVAAGGATVVITGSGYVGVTGVSFGAVPATSFVVDNHRQITAVVPAHAAGIVDVTVTSGKGPSLASDDSKFTFTV